MRGSVTPAHTSGVFRMAFVPDQRPFPHAISVLEQLDEKSTAEEATDVCEHGDSTGCLRVDVRQLRKPREDLESEPPQEDHPRWEWDDPDEDEEEEQHL